MNSREIEKMAQMEDEYWWHVGKKYLVGPLIEKHFGGRYDLDILEVGCGTGALTSYLQKYGKVTAFDKSEDAVNYCTKKGIANVFVADISKFASEDYFEKYDLVLALDVLEHVQDDVGAMEKVLKMLKPGGVFFINVPAHKFLWSEHDEALEHKRRYHRLELTRKLIDAGFEIISNSYFVTFVSPLILFYRAWGNIFGKSAYPKTSYVILPKPLNNFLVWLLKLETKILLRYRFPFGVTLNVIAKKKPL